MTQTEKEPECELAAPHHIETSHFIERGTFRFRCQEHVSEKLETRQQSFKGGKKTNAPTAAGISDK